MAHRSIVGFAVLKLNHCFTVLLAGVTACIELNCGENDGLAAMAWREWLAALLSSLPFLC